VLYRGRSRARFKAKPVIDIVVYRGGGRWQAGRLRVDHGPQEGRGPVAIVGAVIARWAMWALSWAPVIGRMAMPRSSAGVAR
jgi:hypothetical protein